MACVSILIIRNIYLLVQAMGLRDRSPFRAALAYTLASSLFIYAHMNFIEPVGALCCIYVFRKLFQEEITHRDLLISSLLLGILPWVHIRFALLEIGLFFLLLYTLYRLKRF